jgi:hypothetical protein
MKTVSIALGVLGLLAAVNTADAKVSCTAKHEGEDRLWSDAKLLAQTASEIGSAWIGGVKVYDVADYLAQVLDFAPRPESLEETAKDLADCIQQIYVGLDHKVTVEPINQYRTEAEDAQSTLIGGGFPSCTDYHDSRDAVNQLVASDTVFFSRPFDSNDQSTIDQLNKGCPKTGCVYTKNDLGTDANGNVIPGGEVYEWRLALPSLMLAIGYRVQMIAKVYPEFFLDPYQAPHQIANAEEDFDYSQLKNFKAERDEILKYRSALNKHYQKMISDIKCDYYQSVCADVYSGNESNNSTNLSGRYEVFGNLPLYELKAMIDALYFYVQPDPTHPDKETAHPIRYDLAQNYHRVPLFWEPNGPFCLEVNRKEEFGYSVQLTSCADYSRQKWVYDRVQGTIKNSGSVVDPASAQCLRVIGGSTEVKVIASECLDSKNAGYKQLQWTRSGISHSDEWHRQDTESPPARRSNQHLGRLAWDQGARRSMEMEDG